MNEDGRGEEGAGDFRTGERKKMQSLNVSTILNVNRILIFQNPQRARRASAPTAEKHVSVRKCAQIRSEIIRLVLCQSRPAAAATTATPPNKVRLNAEKNTIIY